MRSFVAFVHVCSICSMLQLTYAHDSDHLTHHDHIYDDKQRTNWVLINLYLFWLGNFIVVFPFK